MNAIQALLSWIMAPIQWLGTWPMKVIGLPRRLMGLSFPARVAVILAIFLFVLAVTAYTTYFLISDRPQETVWIHPLRVGLIILLLLIIPLVAYKTLSVWLQGEVARFPDIDAAWQAGLETLAKHQIDLQQVPIFVVLGPPNAQVVDGLMEAAGFTWLVAGVPEGRAPLRWYANEQAVFLSLPGLGCLGYVNEAATKLGRVMGMAASQRGPGGGTPAPSITGTLVVGANVRETAAPIARDQVSDDAPLAMNLRGTLVPGMASEGGSSSGGSASAPPSGRLVTKREMDDAAERLLYISQMLRRARQPLCPVNGLLTVLPLTVLNDIVAAQDVVDGIRRDLSVLREGVQMRVPVTAIVTGMETEAGFLELIGRIGIDRARETRFGKGFSLWTAPTEENMDALSAHACGAFEDWVYTLFREVGGWERPNNSQLYRLLGTIRGHLQRRIRSLLVHGFGEAPDDAADDQVQMFGGCYFAATGDRANQRAFVRGVIDKLLQQEEEIEWTDVAVREDQRYRRLAQTALVANSLLALALVAFIVLLIRRS